MSKIFIKYDKDNVITYTHYKPFDSVYGLRKTESELLKEGALIDEYEEPSYIEGKMTIVKYNQDTNSVYFEYVDAPQMPNKTENETLEEFKSKISILEAENEKLNTQLSTVRASHSDLILDLDFRVMDIEDNLGLVPMNINLFKALGEDDMNSTFMVVLDKIETGNYNTKEEIEGICDRYLARGRITGEEYDMLMKALDKKESEKIN